MRYQYSEDSGHSEIREVVGGIDEAIADAEEYCREGEYGDVTETFWVTARVTPENEDGDYDYLDAETVTVQIDPDEPDCDGDASHDWQSPHEVVGGIESNPGVWGRGGGVIIRECCAHCGAYRVTYTWAQRPDTGDQGLRSVRYEPADAQSQAWLAEGAHA